MMAVLTAVIAQYHCCAGTLLVYNNNDGGAGSLRQAIIDNNLSAGGNTIVFSNFIFGIILTNGELMISKNVTILGPDPDNLFIFAGESNRVFYIGPNVTVTISSLAISGGYLAPTAGFPDNCGAGIFNDHATLTVSNCYVEDGFIPLFASSGANGAGIYNYEGTLTVINSGVYANFTPYDGGGIYNNGGDGSGSATLTVVGSSFSGNTSWGSGGAIYNFGINNGSATLTVNASTFYGNSGSLGSGICTDGTGSGAYTMVAVNASTFCSNSVSTIANVGGLLTLADTILKAGAAGTTIVNSGGTDFSYGDNLASDNGGGFLTNPGDQINTDPMLGPLVFNWIGPLSTTAPLPGSPAIDQGRPDLIPTLVRRTDQLGRYRPYDDPNVPNGPGSDGTDIGAVEVSPAHNIVGTTSDPAGDSLRYCLLDAQPGDTITFSNSVTGTITLTAGELLIDKDLTILGPGANVVSVSGNNSSRVFEVSNNTVSISGLTVQNGDYTNNSNHGETLFGGGVLNAGQLTLSDCAFVQNAVTGATNISNGGTGGSGQGGAIFNLGGLVLNRCTFTGNTAAGAHGSAFSSGGTLGPGGNGGAGQGGAVFNSASGTLTIENSTFASNSVTGGAGGAGSGSIFAGGGNANGAAVFNLGLVTIQSSTVSGNTGTGGAGYKSGVLHGPNGSGNGGLSAGGGTFAVENSIVAANIGSTAPDAEGTFNSGGFNFIGVADQSVGFSDTNAPPDQVGTTGSPLNPLLGPLQDNGGPTPTMALLYGSTAIDNGNNFGLTTDQRGEPRPFDWPLVPDASGGDGSDIGAFERGRPRLNIQQIGTNAVLSWPSYYEEFEFSLQTSTNIASSNNWATAPGTPSVIGTQYFQTNKPISGNRFFRLKSN